MGKTYTTLNKIKREFECHKFYKLLLHDLNKQEPDDEPLSLIDILEKRGIEYALLCLRTLDNDYKLDIAKYAVECANDVIDIFEDKYPDDISPRNALEVSKYLLYSQNPDKVKKLSELKNFASQAVDSTKKANDEAFFSACTCANAAYATYEVFMDYTNCEDIAYDTYFAAWSAKFAKANSQEAIFRKHFSNSDDN
jgi:hypothetical protein